MIIHAVLEKHLHLVILLLVVSSQNFNVGLKLLNQVSKLVAFVNQIGILPQHTLQLVLKLSNFVDPFLLNHRPIDVDRVLYRHLDWHLHSLFDFDWGSIDVDGFVYIDRSLNNRWDLYSSNYFSWDLLDDFHRRLFLNLNIFRHLNNFFDYSLRAKYMLGDLDNDLNWLLDDNLLYYLSRNSVADSKNLFVLLF